MRREKVEELANRLHSASIHLLRLVRAEDIATGIGPAQLSALSVIVFGGPMSLNDLAKAEQVRPPTMSRIVEGMVKAGLADRKRNLQDRRAVLIEPTARGRAILMEGRQRRVRLLTDYLARLSSTERRNLELGVEALQKILRR